MKKLTRGILAACAMVAFSASAQSLYGVAFSVAEIDGKKVVHISDVTVEADASTKESVALAYAERLRMARPDRAALFADKQARLFSSRASAEQFRSDLIGNGKAAGMEVEFFATASAGPSGAPAAKAPAPLDTAWPFVASEAKRRQLDAAQAYGLNVEMKAAGRDFVLIPPGEFVMGSPLDEEGRREDEAPHRVRISKPFYLSRDDERIPVDTLPKLEQWLNQQQAAAPAGYAFRLPTEAEWEYAARAGKATRFHTGDELYGAQFADGKFKGKLEYRNCAGEKVEPVTEVTEDSPLRYRLQGTTLTPVSGIIAYRGCDDADKAIFELEVASKSVPDRGRKFQPNAWGLYDMAGRYEEIVADKYGPYPATGVHVDPLQKTGDAPVVRGGNSTSAAKDVRLASRRKASAEKLDADPKFATMGLRLVLFKLPD